MSSKASRCDLPRRTRVHHAERLSLRTTPSLHETDAIHRARRPCAVECQLLVLEPAADVRQRLEHGRLPRARARRRLRLQGGARGAQDRVARRHARKQAIFRTRSVRNERASTTHDVGFLQMCALTACINSLRRTGQVGPGPSLAFTWLSCGSLVFLCRLCAPPPVRPTFRYAYGRRSRSSATFVSFPRKDERDRRHTTQKSRRNFFCSTVDKKKFRLELDKKSSALTSVSCVSRVHSRAPPNLAVSSVRVQ